MVFVKLLLEKSHLVIDMLSRLENLKSHPIN